MMYVPGFSQELFRSQLLNSDGGLTGGGPAYATISPEQALPYDGEPTMPSYPSIQPSAPKMANYGEMLGGGMGILPSALTDFGLNNFSGALPAAAQTAQPAGLTFLTDRGRQAGYGKGSSGFVAFDPNAQYRMWDERGKNRIVSSGTGEEGLRAIHALANQYNTEQKRKANWGIERFDPTTSQWVRILENDPRKNVAGKIADIALPIALSFTPLGPIGGAAAGSALSSAAQGRSLKNTLLRAGLSAGTAGLMQATGASEALGGALGKAFGNTASNTLGKVAGEAVVDAAGNMILPVAAGSALASGVGAGFGSLASSSLMGALSGAPAPTTPTGTTVGDPIFVPMDRVAGSVAPGVIGAGGGALAGTVVGDPITVTDNRPSDFDAAFPVSDGIVSGSVPALLDGAVPDGEITVEGTRGKPTNDIPLTVGGSNALATIPDMTNQLVQQPEVPQQKSALDKAIDYLRAAGLLTSLVGGIGGGGKGGGALGVIPGGLGGGQLGGVFGAGLPAPTMPGLANRAPRDVNFDWKRYGYGPGQSFFNDVPNARPNTSTAYTGYAEGGYAQGGAGALSQGAYAVEGLGTGRSDEIPAMLSDGEYVMDAETVALLGDGSTKAGAERLDAFRANIRKHKGRQLAQGNFSPDAKSPEHYLRGGRAQ